ncbi:5-formyltetrahydrofolate cyclo-ligase [Nitrosopumilus sp. b1]|uniref:5-formyltetrahydrofolate cyclo-ligase n=1 Tax=Nitrosopumilus sp. b1 TaxID=2109907 RepID=UPI0015F59F76|nr:5-formyltetrahydrofolate cyclo-ligase [Nitrosopumilus sp. b1]KAF6242425.1 5-formyltetrahydrofolate cyclo-ligase [Nitrosopumilus sp. b1]
MEADPVKASLRKTLLEKRDGISFELLKISSKKIHKNLKKIKEFKDAENIACYYPIGSEVFTQDIIQEALSNNKNVFLPRIEGNSLSFRKITDTKDLQHGKFDILEPKEDCPVFESLDVVLVPTIGASKDGARLGYGHGYYDRFLSKVKTTSIALTFSKQIIKSVPAYEHDIKVNWIVTEDKVIKASKIG